MCCNLLEELNTVHENDDLSLNSLAGLTIQYKMEKIYRNNEYCDSLDKMTPKGPSVKVCPPSVV